VEAAGIEPAKSRTLGVDSVTGYVPRGGGATKYTTKNALAAAVRAAIASGLTPDEIREVVEQELSGPGGAS